MNLGKYADTVLWSYLGAFGLIVVLVIISLLQSARTRRALRDAEARMDRTNV